MAEKTKRMKQETMGFSLKWGEMRMGEFGIRENFGGEMLLKLGSACRLNLFSTFVFLPTMTYCSMRQMHSCMFSFMMKAYTNKMVSATQPANFSHKVKNAEMHADAQLQQAAAPTVENRPGRRDLNCNAPKKTSFALVWRQHHAKKGFLAPLDRLIHTFSSQLRSMRPWWDRWQVVIAVIAAFNSFYGKPALHVSFRK